MAEVDTNMLHKDHADIRREAAEHTADIRYNIAERSGDIRRELADVKDVLNDATRVEGGSTRFQGAQNTSDIIREGMKGDFNTRGDIKDTRHDILREVDRQGDRITNLDTQYYIASQQNANEAARDLASLKVLTDANAARYSIEMALNIEKVGAASALQAEKIASAVALGQAVLSKEIFHDGQKTRDLINDLKYHDLNRALVERNSELVNCEQDRGRYHDNWWDSRFGQYQSQSGAQFAAMQQQLQSMNQNFNSQLSETRQGMVNFGTMAGVGQTSSANNVR